MRLLLLGGTSFIGRTIAEEALRACVDLTLFSRGLTGNELFPSVPRLVGDRDAGDYSALEDGSWDAVVDVSGYVPRHVGQAAEALGDRVGRYLFISSQAVYERSGVVPGADEDAPLRPPVRDTEELSEDTYGPLKVACEQELVSRYGDRATVVRPGKVAGPYDSSDAFTYWVRRAAQGGRAALPGHPEQPVELVDSRALASLVVRLVLDDRGGAFNAGGPPEPTSLGELIHLCAEVAGTSVEVVPVPEGSGGPFFPLVRDRSAWSGLQRSCARAYTAGLPRIPLAQTATDVLAWDQARGLPRLTSGFTPADEAALLA
ncbi:NAD-dependent epimerase/dehydratase family protein [Kribbella deserti]|uniref:NAD-dependent epimerase/dehydratase family protein n=1 Tax=Kribbella deserti TaxID=1926257 RepID=A0ABV6QRD0_9ACTN